MNSDALIRDLNALLDPGVEGTTIKDTQRPTAASVDSAAPKGWEPGVKFSPDGLGMTVTTTAQTVNVQRNEGAWTDMVRELGLEVPDGFVVRLVEAKYDPGAWARDADDRGKPHSAYRSPVWRYRFAVEHSSRQVHVEDVDRIIAEVMRKRRKRPAAAGDATPRALNVVYADPQAGKVALLGGTRELAARVGDCFDLLTDHLADLKKVGRAPTEATWLDAGDCVEGFSNVPSQKYTNDLSMTQMIRAHRRFTLFGLDYLAGRFPKVQAVTCGSNHGQVREGKDPVGPPDNDWGIEVLSQVQDAYARNEDAYGHVSFGYPHHWRDSLAVESGGLLLGLAHGHQWRNPDPKAVRTWWHGQTFGRQPVADARVLVAGHFHHLAAKEMGNGRLFLQAPTLDNGSDWFSQVSGEVSTPGLLVFSSTPDGWDDLRILRGSGEGWEAA